MALLPFAKTAPRPSGFPFLCGHGAKRMAPAPAPAQRDPGLAGKTVYYPTDLGPVPAVVVSDDGATLRVKLAMPDGAGVLHVSNEDVTLPHVDGIKEVSAVLAGGEAKMRSFREDLDADVKAATAVKDGDGRIVDYLDVRIEGYASTFKDTTPADRDGDYILPGAFAATLVAFKRNPVLLVNHENKVESLAGSFEKLSTTKQGLAITALLSNAPGLRDLRFKVAEGHLRALSIGGLFRWGVDGKAIESVDLWEISLIPVPANPDALVQVRSLTLEDAKCALLRHANKGPRP
jgi:HK97 family phage prohead protease